jgi:YesN/AraC family two-component response regulator
MLNGWKVMVAVMYTLLIVDDERWVRQGLRSTIDWQAEGIEVLGEAEDGEEALMLIELQTPDIIITDIKMPGMDGLALIETVKNRKLPTKIVIISGYSDFSFAQKAMRCGASDYVLKPIEETQILDVVRRCVIEIKREREDHHHFVRMSECIRESLPLARQQYLEMLLTNKSASRHNWKILWDQLDIRLDPNRLKVICVKVYDWGSNVNDQKGQYLLRYALGNIAEEIGAVSGKMMTFPLENHEDADLVILQSPSEEDDSGTERCMESLIEAGRRYLGIRINIGISQIREYANLSVSFQEAIQSSAYAFYDGYGKVYETERPEQPYSLQLQEYTGPSGWDTRLVHALKLGKETVLSELIEELIAHVKMNRTKYHPYQFRNGVTNLLYEIEKKLESSHSSEHSAINKLYVPFCTLSELKNELMTVVRQFQRIRNTIGNRKRVIELALNYMQEHFTETISMNRVAEQHYLNPSYFSKIFHEETGETFCKYLIRLRMEKAKNLLKDSTLKVYEVAEQVSYQDFRHFIKLFKAQEGITPAQYRDLGVL